MHIILISIRIFERDELWVDESKMQIERLTILTPFGGEVLRQKCARVHCTRSRRREVRSGIRVDSVPKMSGVSRVLCRVRSSITSSHRIRRSEIFVLYDATIQIETRSIRYRRLCRKLYMPPQRFQHHRSSLFSYPFGVHHRLRRRLRRRRLPIS